MSKFVKSVTNTVKSVVKSVANVVTSVVKAAVNLVADVINMVASPFMGLMGGTGSVPDAAAETQRQDGVLVQRQGSNENIPVVYGYRKVGGKIIFAETGSTNNQYLWVAYAFSEGCVEGLNELWLDDNQLSASVVQRLNAGEIVDVTDTKYSGRVRYQWFPGVYYSDPSSSTIGSTSICKDAPSWNNKMVFNGVAVLFARYQWKAITTQAEADSNPFSGGIPQVQVCIMGRRVASLRTGSNAENYSYQGSGYVERYSTNPAEILLDYLRNPRFGKGLANTDIDWESFRIAAAKCDQTVTYSNSVTGPILTLNYVLDTSATLFSNVKVLLQNFRGYLPYVQGKYKLKIEDAGNPTNILSGAATIDHTFTKDNIVGDITYTAIDKSSKYNHVSVNWVDPDQKWSVQQVVYPSDETTRQIYINYDGGRENSLETTLGGITNSQIALDMARLLFNKSRFQESCSFQASAEAMELEPGDNIYIKGNILTFENVPWRIISIKLNNDYTCDIGCVRNPDFIYPYVQANTPDSVTAPYVPIGSTIKAPVEGTTAPVGLYPPVRAPLPDGYVWPINSGTNPPPTSADGVNGGGVGVSTSTQNTNPSNPTTPQPIAVLRDYVVLDRADYTYSGDSVYVDITFRQPVNSQYKSLLIWYKPSAASETVWRQVEATDRPGPGNNISYRLGPMAGGSSFPQYDIQTRVVYQSGEMSTVLGTSQLNTSGSGVTTQDPSDSQVIISSGWQLVTTRPTGRRDDIIGDLKNVNSGNVSTLTNTADVLYFKQNTTGIPINYDITGVKMYYRPYVLDSNSFLTNTSTYFYERDIDFPVGQYVPGSTIEIPNPVKFTYPNNEDIPTASRWDIICKFKYVDSTYSRKHSRIMNVGSSPITGQDSFGGGETGVIEYAGSYPITTIAMAISTGSVADPKTLTCGAMAIEADYQNPNLVNMNIFMALGTTSADAYLRGYRVLYRPRNGNGVWTTYDTLDTRNQATRGAPATACSKITLAIASYDVEYQIAVIPLIYNPVTRAREEGYNCIFGSGSIHNRTASLDYPYGNNWINLFHFRNILASAARQESAAPPAAAATLNDTVIVKQYQYLYERIPGQLDSYGVTATNLISCGYYSIKIDTNALSDFVKLHIYRRLSLSLAPATNRSKYLGLSQWEHLELTAAELTTNINRINLRPPMGWNNFKSTSGTTSTHATLYDTTKTTIGTDNGFRLFYPYDIGGTEFYLVVENSLGICQKAVWLKTNTDGYIFGQADILANLGIPNIVNFPGTIDNGIDLGWDRKLSEATSGIPWDHLRFNSTIPAVVSGSLQKPFIGVTPSTGPAII